MNDSELRAFVLSRVKNLESGLANTFPRRPMPRIIGGKNEKKDKSL